jgi:hypothetical protein
MSVSPEFQFHALGRAFFVQAEQDGGEVSGMVLGLGWFGGEHETFYLVSDLRRPAPVWVSEAELVRQRWTTVEALPDGSRRASTDAFPPEPR